MFLYLYDMLEKTLVKSLFFNSYKNVFIISTVKESILAKNVSITNNVKLALILLNTSHIFSKLSLISSLATHLP